MHRTKRRPQNNFANEMNRFFDDLFGANSAQGDCGTNVATNYFRPPVNISETDDNYIIDVAVPGWEKSDFEIKVEGDYLTIKGEKVKATEATNATETTDENTENAEPKVEVKKSNVKFLKREFKTRNFKRTFTLSDKANKESIDANYVNGILTITVAKLEAAKPISKIVEIA